jgi:hypothetical protein
MNVAQYLLTLGMKPQDLSVDTGLATPAIVRPNYAMAENGDPDGLVRVKDHNNDPVPNSKRRRSWV